MFNSEPSFAGSEGAADFNSGSYCLAEGYDRRSVSECEGRGKSNPCPLQQHAGKVSPQDSTSSDIHCIYTILWVYYGL